MAGAKDQDFLQFALDQLAAMTGITSRRMFGAIGLYHGDTFFAIIDEGRLYFVTDEATRAAYTKLGTKPFQYAPDKFLHTYYEVPVDVLEDDRTLCEWARAAVAAQGRRKSTPRRPARTPRRGESGPRTRATSRTKR